MARGKFSFARLAHPLPCESRLWCPVDRAEVRLRPSRIRLKIVGNFENDVAQRMDATGPTTEMCPMLFGPCIVCRKPKHDRLVPEFTTSEDETMAEFEERDLAESDPRQYSASSEHKSLVLGVGFLFVLTLAIWLVWYGWGLFKRIGWIPQTRVINVHMSGVWPTGEIRACKTDGHADVLFCLKSGESQTALATNGLAPRSFSVSFHGNITGKSEDRLTWNCRRETESIDCRAVQ